MLPSFTVWKSTVMPRGVPSSSFRAYRLPILADESSVLLEMPNRRSFAVTFWRIGLKSALLDSGTRRTFVGATPGGNDRTCKKQD